MIFEVFQIPVWVIFIKPCLPDVEGIKATGFIDIILFELVGLKVLFKITGTCETVQELSGIMFELRK